MNASFPAADDPILAASSACCADTTAATESQRASPIRSAPSRLKSLNEQYWGLSRIF